MPSTDRTIQLDSPEEGRILRQFLQENRYDRKSLGPLLGSRGNLALLLHQTREPNLYHTLVRWFVIGRAVDEKTANAFVPHNIIALLLKTGLLIRRQESLAPSVLLLPFEDALVACDHAVESDSPPPDVVIGPNAPAGRLLHFTVRRRIGSALDLCCGGGIQAMYLAAHCDSVAASDLNPRALAFARFNARLHGVENIEFLHGDGFSTVAGRCFDLIVANPPFYLLPATELLYRDNPLELDGFARELIRQAPRYLNEGGLFQMVFEWAEIEGQPWRERLAEWLPGTACDAWVLRNYTSEPIGYCEARLRSGGLASLDRDLETLARWTEYYDRHKVTGMHGGVIALRKRSGARNWIEVEETPLHSKEPLSSTVESFFNAQDLAIDGSEETLLALRPRLSPHTRLDQASAAGEQGWQAPSMQLVLTHGLQRTCAVDQPVATFLSHFDGKRSLRELLEFLPPNQGSNADQMRAACLTVTRQLLRRGFILADS